MRYSYSRVECFANCPYKYKLFYLDKLDTIPEQNADNPLYLGTAIHLAFETGDLEKAIENYESNYNIISDGNINEEIKLEYLIPKVLELLPEAECEVEIKTDDFVGYIDRLVPTYTDDSGIKHYEIWDYKYSNNIEHYLLSGQLHLYKYYFELTHPNTVVDKLRYVFIPKVAIRQKLKAKPPETLQEFRNRIVEHLDASEIKIVEVEYDADKVKAFLEMCKYIDTVKSFDKRESKLCDWCSFKAYCQSDGQEDWMILPKKF